MVSVLTFYSDDPSLNAVEDLSFYSGKIKKSGRERPKKKFLIIVHEFSFGDSKQRPCN